MNERAKTLVILSPGFPENEADTTCVPAQQVFVRNLKLNYPHLNIIVLAFEYPFFTAEYQWNGVRVISFGGRNRGKLYRLYNWMLIRKTLNRLNTQYRLIGLLSFWLGDCAFIANRFSKKNNLKHFCWLLGQDAKPGNKYVKLIKPQPGSLIALSDFIAKEFYKNYAITPAHVIPPGVDPTLFNVIQTGKDIDILGVGSLILLKQFTLLVDMVKSLRNDFPDIKAVICGDGPEWELLNKMIKEHHLEKNIELTGELPHKSVLALMQRAKIFVHPSAYEGFGMVCLEALYAGTQVVSFVHPMNTEIRNWHYAQAQGDMLNIVKSLMENPAGNHLRVAPYLIANTNKSAMNLFDYSEATT